MGGRGEEVMGEDGDPGEIGQPGPKGKVLQCFITLVSTSMWIEGIYATLYTQDLVSRTTI